MRHSLFRPKEISGKEIAEKRVAIGNLYSIEWAAKMPWYQVLAVYRSLEERGRFSGLRSPNYKYPGAGISPLRKAPRASKRHPKIDDGIQLSMFD